MGLHVTPFSNSVIF